MIGALFFSVFLPAVLHAQVNECLTFCRNEVLNCVRQNVSLAVHSKLARCILQQTDAKGDTESECGACVVKALGANNCSKDDGTTDLDCVDRVMSADRCNTSISGQEACDADSTCEWCPDWGVCASMTRCQDFAPTAPPVEKPKKGDNKNKFECVSKEGASGDMAITCKGFGAKKKCQRGGCEWIKKAEPNPVDGGENSVTTMAQLKSVCEQLFKEAQTCKKGCANGRIRKGKCSAPKNPPASCRKFADEQSCSLVAGCKGGGKKKFSCKGTPELTK